jgi:uncharacterized phage protein gp47/JayE
MADSLEDLATNTTLTRMSAGSKTRAFLEAANKRLEEGYDIFDLGVIQSFVSSAPGQFLDLIGDLVGLQRNVASTSKAGDTTKIMRWYVASPKTFGDINGGGNIVIPTGTVISTGANQTGTVWRTTSDSVLSSADSEAFFSAEATAPGEDSNVGAKTLVHHNFVDYTDYLNDTLLVTNVHAVANGQDAESDANFRFRIVNRVVDAEAANETAIRLAILSTAGVADVILIPRYRGIGTFGAIIQSTQPTVSDSLLTGVRANVKKVTAIGDLGYIRGPKETGLSMTVTVHYRKNLSEAEYEEIEDSISDLITASVNDLDIGEGFVVNKLAADIFSVSEDIANLGDPGEPFDDIFVHRTLRTETNKVREKLLGDYTPERDERVIMEPSLATPITLKRKFSRR